LFYDCVSGDRSVAVYECSDHPSDDRSEDITAGRADVEVAGELCRFEIRVSGRGEETRGDKP
jgi:hypothetical protein